MKSAALLVGILCLNGVSAQVNSVVPQVIATKITNLATTTSSIASNVGDILIATNLAAPSKCPSGCQRYYDGCNECRCYPDGSTACTDHQCFHLDTPRCLELSNGSTQGGANGGLPSILSYEEACKAGCQVYNDGCNNCTCNADGTVGACTEMACLTSKKVPACIQGQLNIDGVIMIIDPPPPRNDDHILVDPLPEKPQDFPEPELVEYMNVETACKSGCKSFFDGCNTCSCNADGTAACTMMFCTTMIRPDNPPRCLDVKQEPPKENPPALTIDLACKSGCKSFFDGCNTCSCDKNGNHACTKKFCLNSNKTQPRCLETPTPIETETPLSKACKSGCKSYYDGCNTCQCSLDGTAACTKMMCVTMIRENDPPRCLDNEIVEVNEEEELSGVEKACKSGCKSYFDGCNQCSCTANGPVCTMKFCTALYNPNNPARCLDKELAEQAEAADQDSEEPVTTVVDPKEVCPVGCTAWYDGCNNCTCAGVGKLGACTKRFCIRKDRARCVSSQTPVSSTTTTTTKASSSGSSAAKTCPTNCKSFYDGCNSCTCNRDGSKGACTLKMCFQYEDANCSEYYDNNNNVSSLSIAATSLRGKV